MSDENGRPHGVEFSKLLLLIQCAASALLILAVVVCSILGKDVTALAALAGGSVIADGTVSSFYLSKARSENRAKYAEKFAMKFAKDYGFESAIQNYGDCSQRVRGGIRVG